jgi:hypothetical protein
MRTYGNRQQQLSQIIAAGIVIGQQSPTTSISKQFA